MSSFRKVTFPFRKQTLNFQRIALDQVHEQNNKIIKGSGGAKHLLNRNDESGLIRWETVGSDVARLLSEFEDSIDAYNTTLGTKKHHEDNMVFQDTFLKDVQKVYIGMLSNPFEIDKLTSISNTSYSFPDVVFDNISKLKETGKRLFD